MDLLPPNDLDAEKAILDTVLAKPETLPTVADAIRPDDFYISDHRRLFHHVVALWRKCGTIDAVGLQSEMGVNGRLADADAAMIADLFSGHWTPNAIEHHIRTVKSHSDARHVIEIATGILRDAYNGVSAAVLQKRLETALERIDAGSGTDFAPMTLAQLMARDVAVEYLIDNLIAARQPILLAGPVKSMKTSILLDLCFALVTGGHFLGYFRVLRSIAVGVMTGESDLPTIKDTLERIGRAAMIDPAGVSRLIISDRIPHLSDPAHLDAIRRLILDYELELLAVDPAYLALDGSDASNVMLFGQQLRAVSELCQEMGVALLLCHHTKKGSGIDGEPLDLTDAAWSGFAEHCRQWILVNHRKYDEDSATHRLWLKGGGSAGHGGLWAVDVHQGHITDIGGRVWDVSVSTPNEVREQVADRKEASKETVRQDRLERDKRTVANTMAKFPTGESKSIIRDTAGIFSSRFNAALSALLANGAVVPCEIRKPCRKTPFTGFKLAGEATHE